MPVLQFKGRSAVESYHHAIPHHTLEFDADLSEPNGQVPGLDGNLIVEGDNLLALKALLPTHAGRVKCIYIDPPYNTGNEGWVYNDNLTQPQFKEWIGQTVGKEGEDACRHDKWCCMMYPRLQLLKELLTDDGAIFVSIGDDELHNLRSIMDEVFDASNFVATLVWQKAKKGDSKLISKIHEYILVYARDKRRIIAQGGWRMVKPGVDEVLKHHEEIVAELRPQFPAADGEVRDWPSPFHQAIAGRMRQWYASLRDDDPRKAHSHYRWSDDRGLYFAADLAGPDDGRESRPRDDIMHPTTGKPCEKPSTGWRWGAARRAKAMAERPMRIHFGPDDTTVPCRKTYLKDAKTKPFPSVFYKDGRAATLELERIIGAGKWEFPKDPRVLGGLINLCAGPDDWVLDSFAGSGTTAQAVLEQNKALGFRRRFVLVQIKHDTKKHEEKRLNLCEKITAERIRKNIRGFSFSGKQRTVLHEEKITLANLRRAGELLARLDAVRGANAAEFDAVSMGLKVGVLTVTGLKNVRLKTQGLGGSFTYARLGPPLLGEYRNFGDVLPSYEELAKYIFYTETSREFDPRGIDPETGKIGEHGEVSYFLLYTPNGVEDRALDLPWLKAIDRVEPEGRKLVVYCEKIWVHRDDLIVYRKQTKRDVRPMLVPFNLK